MKKLITSLLILSLSFLPTSSFAGIKNDRAACILLFGALKNSCKKGFGKNYGEFVKDTTNQTVNTFVEGFKNPTGDGGSKPSTKDLKFIAKKITPSEIRFEFDFSGSGILVIYKSRDKVEKIAQWIENKSANWDMVVEIIPDQFRIIVGLQLALVLTVKARSHLVYTTRKDIEDIIEILNK